MFLTVEHILDLITQLPANTNYEYVSGGESKAKIISIDRENVKVEIARVNADGTEKNASMTTDILNTLAASIKENKPFKFDNVLNGSGNVRSTMEALFAHTSEFYYCKINNVKHLVWIPTRKKETGVIKEISILDIPVSESENVQSTELIREEFKYYLSNCVKSVRGKTSLGTFIETSVSSYLNMLDKREDGTIKLFDYNPSKWVSIQNVYDIVDPLKAEEIFHRLLDDPDFVKWDKEDNSGWRSGALNLYILFLRAKKYFSKNTTPFKTIISKTELQTPLYLPYLTALRTKPFMLLAGISGTGKSRIVREMAKACWKDGDPEFGKNHPKNFCMVQVKPNWHDSSDLIGYVSRLNGEKFVVGPFLRFLAAAIKDPDTPYFLCLDEMNLAPVEQYFAEYLSVIESREFNDSGIIETDPIVPFEDTVAYGNLIDQLFDTPEERKAYKTAEGGKRLTIPQNFFVVGTVNMDETTFSFSRKVLDRAMTIEMNEVDLHGGLEKGAGNDIGYIGNCIIGDAAEGCDVYEENRELCDQVLAYLEQVNAILEGSPFKIAYRTRNEFLMYAVNRKKLDEKSQLWQSLDEMTSMKILSRIEGDEERTKKVLDGLKALVEEQIVSVIPPAEEGNPVQKSISAAKIDEMLAKLKATGFTSYWA